MEYKNNERPFKNLVLNGFAVLLAVVALFILFVLSFVFELCPAFCSAGLVLLAVFFCAGLFKLEPNEARVMVFFGTYKGTFRRTGFYWVNPFITGKTVSLRVRNLNPEPIKVNDKSGNPVMIGMVVVWKLEDTYKALFEIDSQSLVSAQAGNVTVGPASQKTKLAVSLEKFVSVQSDAALRQVAGYYSYDNTDAADEPTLRSNADEINTRLVAFLNERVSMAGIRIIEARINYLAYASEIAAVMLRRQQADAIIAAREKIVQGAVSMVKMALDNLRDEGVVELDEERKAAMVSNLLVVLCGDQPAQPVVNSGTLY